jgi:phosphomannomutase
LVIIGYDTRFLGKEFALTTVEILSENGIDTLLTERDAPTPAISFNIIKRKAIGGINITASHNPHQYQGLKFSNEKGAPAPPETTKVIEQKIAELQGNQHNCSFPSLTKYKTFDPRPVYFAQIKKLIDF